MMVHTIRLKINGTETDLAWSEFVAKIDSTETSTKLFEHFDTALILQCSTLLFLMQAGFILMETGSLSTKRRANALILKNLGDTVLCAFFYFLIGFGFSHGEGGPFIGKSGFFGVGEPLCDDGGTCSSKEYSLMFFRFLKTATAVTILSGCIAERVHLWVYYLLVSVSSCFSLPLLARWINHSKGWAYPYTHPDSLFRTGVMDFAGAGEVCIAGALPALILLPLIGPRRNRFDGEWKEERLPSQNNYFKTLGATIMWMSWYGLVFGGVTTLRTNGGAVVAKIAVNTTISAVAASITAIAFGLYYERKLCPTDASNGILSGLVGITGACATVDTEWALFIGMVSGLIYFSLTKVFLNLQIDDVVDGVQIHLCCGIWSLIATALFSSRDLVKVAYPDFEDENVPCGLLYQCNGLGSVQLAANLVYCALTILWIGLTSSLIILPLWYFDLIRYSSRTDGEDTQSDYTGDTDSAGSDVTDTQNLIQDSNIDRVDAALKTIEERNSPEKLVPCRVRNELVIREEEEVEDNESSLQNKAKIAEQIRKASLQTGDDPLSALGHIKAVYPDIEGEDLELTPPSRAQRSGSLKSGEFNIEWDSAGEDSHH